MKIADGAYVKVEFAAGMRTGTLHVANDRHGAGRYYFRLDPRYLDKLAEFVVEEGDVKQCARLSDEEVSFLNFRIASLP